MKSTPISAGAAFLAVSTGTAVPAAHAGGARYQITDLTELAEPLGVVQSEARGVNAAGQAVGFELLPDFAARAIFWDSDGTPVVLERLPGDNSAISIEIEDDSAIFGMSSLVEVENCGPLICIFEDRHAAMWPDGGPVPVNLDDFVTGGDTSFNLEFAQDRNGAGRIVGSGRDIAGPPFDPRGFLLDEDGIVTSLGLLTSPVAINEFTQVVGYGGGQDHAYLWDQGNLVELHEDPAIGGVTSRAWDINDAGLVVGEIQFEGSDPEEPGAWLGGSAFKLVPELVRPQGIATAANNAGQVVGFYINLDDLNDTWHGFIWENGVRTDLLDLVPPEEGWEILYAFDINDRGQIVGGGLRNGQIGRAFIMTPIETCPFDLDGDGSVGITDLLALLGAWGDPWGIADLLALLADWGPCG
jgi:uncharacterized membrane protein